MLSAGALFSPHIAAQPAEPTNRTRLAATHCAADRPYHTLTRREPCGPVVIAFTSETDRVGGTTLSGVATRCGIASDTQTITAAADPPHQPTESGPVHSRRQPDCPHTAAWSDYSLKPLFSSVRQAKTSTPTSCHIEIATAVWGIVLLTGISPHSHPPAPEGALC